MTHSFTENSFNLPRNDICLTPLVELQSVLIFLERKDENTKKFKKLMMDNCDFDIHNYHGKQDLIWILF